MHFFRTFPLLLIFGINITFGATQDLVTPHIAPRSQGVNLPRHSVGWVHETHLYERNSFYGSLSIIPAYDRSFNAHHLAQCLFGTSLGPCNTINVSGSQVANRGAQDWLADYFYLPTDFQSTLQFKPVIDNFIIDANLYFGLEEYGKGVYCIIYFPIVHSRWNLNFCERVQNPGVNDYVPGYFSSSAEGIPRNELLKNVSQFMSGKTISPSDNETNILFEPLANALILPEKHIRTRIADVRVSIGWDAVNNACGRFGFYFQGAAPTGNTPEGKVLFESIVGNGHHWEFGGGISGNWNFWYSEDEKHSCELYFDATITHFFAKEQTSTFDLKGKPLSRYMLAERMIMPSQNLKVGDSADDAQVPKFQFNNDFSPVANLTTFPVNVKIDVQADIICILNYAHTHWNVDIGYNFWARSCEIIEPITRFEPIAHLRWALKGDAQVFGFDRGIDGTGPIIQTIALSATESDATIHQGTNNTPSNQSPTNPGVDSPALAFVTSMDPLLNNDPLNSVPAGNALAQINSSIIPQIITPGDIEFVGTRGSSSKFFMHIHYQIPQRNSGWIPFIGFGGEVEFAHNGKDECAQENCITCEQPCLTCAVSQWGIWIKGGASF
jgi:hypothetical protein